MLPQAAVHVQEDDAQLLPLFPQAVVDHLGFVLGAHTGQELALRLGDAQAIEGALDLLRNVIPGAALLLCGAQVVVDVVEVDAAQVRAPGGHGLGPEDVQSLVPELAHPVRFILQIRDLVDELVTQPLLGLENRLHVIVESVLVFLFYALELFQIRLCSHGFLPLFRCADSLAARSFRS